LKPVENVFFFHRGVAPTALVVGGQNTAATLFRTPFEPCWARDATPGGVMGRCASGRSAVIPGRLEEANPESRDSPMRNCASEVWSFGLSRNDYRRERATPRPLAM